MSPSAVRFNARPLPDCRNSPSDLGCKSKISFRSRGFSPPQRFAPLIESGCIATRADHGVHCVSDRLLTWTGQDISVFPAMRIPLEEFPLSVAVPHHCGPCPPVVTTQLAFHTPRRRSEELRPGQNLTRSSASRSPNPILEASAETPAPCEICLGKQNVRCLNPPQDESRFLPRFCTALAPLPSVASRRLFGRNQRSSLPCQMSINQLLAPTLTTLPKQGRKSTLHAGAGRNHRLREKVTVEHSTQSRMTSHPCSPTTGSSEKNQAARPHHIRLQRRNEALNAKI